jgi:hypothetical protein
MENEDVVNDQPTTDEESQSTQTESMDEATLKSSQPGTKTDPNLLLQSLKTEREKRRVAEEKLNLLEASQVNSVDDTTWSDEGKALKSELGAVNKQIADLKREGAKKDLLIANPLLKEHFADFEEYLEDPENKGMNVKTAAKAFMIDRGLMETPRKGLEKPTGGDKTPSSLGSMTASDVEKLRTTNYKKYMDMLQKGQLDKIV